jgi:undecaprenyl-diphosphatase
LLGFFYCRDTLLQQAETVEWGPLELGTLVDAVSAYLSIHFFMRLIEQVGMLPFVI